MKLFNQIVRDFFIKKWVITSIILLFSLISFFIVDKYIQISSFLHQNKGLYILLLTLLVGLTIFICKSLTDIYSLQRKETAITCCQITILLAIAIWIIGVVIIFDPKQHPGIATAFGIIGGTISWIFKDTLVGIVAFIHLRINNLLHIDDWIEIPEKGVDGMVTRVSLTNVTISNWDTTVSSIPTSMLHSNHFINYQKMMEGKTHGRRMYKTFIIDTGWVHLLSEEEAVKLGQDDKITQYLPKSEITKGRSTAQLFRLYLYHYLMNHPHVSQQPRLIVRWTEHSEAGMLLQVYAFIIDSSLPSFEWQQSLIIEHLMTSLHWFGLRLYQSPSNYDVSNSNIYMTDQPANYREEE